MFFAHGHYVNTNNIDTKPSILEAQALESFARYKNIPIKDVSNYIAELIIKEIPEKTDTLPALVYKVYLFADYPQNTEIGFIDAHTGNLRMTEPAFIDFSATGLLATLAAARLYPLLPHDCIALAAARFYRVASKLASKPIKIKIINSIIQKELVYGSI